jgi:hypothetical protein
LRSRQQALAARLQHTRKIQTSQWLGAWYHHDIMPW